MLIEPVDDDPIRKFDEIEKERLTRNLAELIRVVRQVDCTKNYTIDLICSWHHQLFNGVRDHAGKCRSRDYGEDILNFGPHRSIPRADVLNKLEKHIKNAQNLFSQLITLEKTLESARFVGEVLKAALYLHVELIKIHPFRDGNGRVGRLIITYILSRYNLPPLPIEAPRDEYIACLNHYYLSSNNDLDPLYKLSLRIYKNQS